MMIRTLNPLFLPVGALLLALFSSTPASAPPKIDLDYGSHAGDYHRAVAAAHRQTLSINPPALHADFLSRHYFIGKSAFRLLFIIFFLSFNLMVLQIRQTRYCGFERCSQSSLWRYSHNHGQSMGQNAANQCEFACNTVSLFEYT